MGNCLGNAYMLEILCCNFGCLAKVSASRFAISLGSDVLSGLLGGQWFYYRDLPCMVFSLFQTVLIGRVI